MLTFFQVCFFVGIGLILISFIFGNLLEILGFDGLDLDFTIFGINLFLPLNPTLLMLFSAAFGGMGWILILIFPAMGIPLVILISAAVGIGAASLVHFLVLKPLKKAQNTSTPAKDELVGVMATVSETILAGGFGEIRYVVNGNSYTSPAKATNKEEIKAGKEVVICWIKNHVFYVVRLEER
jgi:membrane protein implicated in regulation of membrane protease activity